MGGPITPALAQIAAGTQGLKFFGGALDTTGGVSIQVPHFIMQQFSGLQVWGLSLTLTPGGVQFSNIAAITLQ